MIVYWDMDGVLTDLYGTIATHHGVTREFLYEDNERCHEYYVRWTEEMGGLDKAFHQVEPNQLEEMRRVMMFLHGKGCRQEILTSYGVFDPLEMGARIHVGKQRWLLEHYRDYFQEGVLEGFNGVAYSKHKARFADPRSILVDDNRENVLQFSQAGGKGVLYRREDHLACIRALLKEIDTCVG